MFRSSLRTSVLGLCLLTGAALAVTVQGRQEQEHIHHAPAQSRMLASPLDLTQGSRAERLRRKIDPERPDAVEGRWSIAIDPDDAVQVSIASDRWVVLETAARLLHTQSGVIDLSELLPTGSEPVLAAPDAASPTALIAHRGGLLAVPLDGGDPRALVEGRDGIPAQPVAVDGCVLAAWSDGAAWRDCAGEPELLLWLRLPLQLLFLWWVWRVAVVRKPQAGSGEQ